jgi:hypothetical protein
MLAVLVGGAVWFARSPLFYSLTNRPLAPAPQTSEAPAQPSAPPTWFPPSATPLPDGDQNNFAGSVQPTESTETYDLTTIALPSDDEFIFYTGDIYASRAWDRSRSWAAGVPETQEFIVSVWGRDIRTAFTYRTLDGWIYPYFTDVFPDNPEWVRALPTKGADHILLEIGTGVSAALVYVRFPAAGEGPVVFDPYEAAGIDPYKTIGNYVLSPGQAWVALPREGDGGGWRVVPLGEDGGTYFDSPPSGRPDFLDDETFLLWGDSLSQETGYTLYSLTDPDAEPVAVTFPDPLVSPLSQGRAILQDSDGFYSLYLPVGIRDGPASCLPLFPVSDGEYSFSLSLGGRYLSALNKDKTHLLVIDTETGQRLLDRRVTGGEAYEEMKVVPVTWTTPNTLVATLDFSAYNSLHSGALIYTFK